MRSKLQLPVGGTCTYLRLHPDRSQSSAAAGVPSVLHVFANRALEMPSEGGSGKLDLRAVLEDSPKVGLDLLSFEE